MHQIGVVAWEINVKTTRRGFKELRLFSRDYYYLKTVLTPKSKGFYNTSASKTRLTLEIHRKPLIAFHIVCRFVLQSTAKAAFESPEVTRSTRITQIQH